MAFPKGVLADIGFGNSIRTVSTGHWDHLRGSIFVNQLVSKIYAHPDVYKSKCPGFKQFGNY